MTTLPFADLKADVLALCGIPDGNTQEVSRIERFMNMRARKAYAMSEIWPRWFVRGEERVCSEEGLIPYEEEGLRTIGTVRRIFATEPFATCGAAKYDNFVAASDGIQIAGYCPREVSDFRAPMLVVGTVFPGLDGTYRYTGQGSTGADGTTTAPEYESASNENNTLTASLSFTLTAPPTFLGYRWNLRGTSGTDYWRTGISSDYTTPDEASGSYEAQGGASDSGVTVTKITTYSVWVTYKAAFTGDYEDGDDVPEEWADYIVRGSYADWLRSETRSEEAVIAEAEARDFIDDQLVRITSQGGSDVYTNVVTHGNTQYR